MKIKLNKGGLRRSKWYEYLIRFAFGGTITAVAGLVAGRFGPVAGGFLLAFPAILPAAATLIEKHERQKKERAGQKCEKRGREAAGVDAAGAAMGSIGLVAFALVVWQTIADHGTALVLIGATIIWLLVSVALWGMRETLFRRIRAKCLRSSHEQLSLKSARSPSINRRLDE